MSKKVRGRLPKISKSATFEDRAIVLARRLGVAGEGDGPTSATQWIRLWADIGMSLSEKEPEFRRGPGRPRGFRLTSKDWELIVLTERLASKSGCSFDKALSIVIADQKKRGLLPAAARNTHSQRIRRAKREFDMRERNNPLRRLVRDSK